jgi:hypothetical protein
MAFNPAESDAILAPRVEPETVTGVYATELSVTVTSPASSVVTANFCICALPPFSIRTPNDVPSYPT